MKIKEIKDLFDSAIDPTRKLDKNKIANTAYRIAIEIIKEASNEKTYDAKCDILYNSYLKYRTVCSMIHASYKKLPIRLNPTAIVNILKEVDILLCMKFWFYVENNREKDKVLRDCFNHHSNEINEKYRNFRKKKSTPEEISQPTPSQRPMRSRNSSMVIPEIDPVLKESV